MYFQELRAHQTVWGSAEIHPDHGDPGLVTTNGAFSLLASLGISSIPFREYLVLSLSLFELHSDVCRMAVYLQSMCVIDRWRWAADPVGR
jgi:hypothetical protein